VGFLFKTKIELPYTSLNLLNVKISKLVQRLSAFFILLFYLTCCQPAGLVPPVDKSTAYNYLQTVADRWQGSNPLTAKSDNNDNKTRNNLSFLLSYKTQASNNTFDLVMQHVAFSYDNAVAAIAFIAVNDQNRAKQIVDTLVYAQNHDRFYQDGRLRNAYWGGKLISSGDKVQLPGWFNQQTGRWTEDEFQVSTHTGSIAWAMLALLAYYQTYGGESYLTAVKKMGEWVDKNLRDTRGTGGYLGGFSGWEPTPNLLKYKSTEHNLDLYVAFQRLFLITGEQVWKNRATYAQNFVISMWDKEEKKFWTGTTTDGVTINQDVIPLDVQAWTPLALKDVAKSYLECLEYAEKHHRVGKGFDFNQDQDGIWYEGTAQMAVTYQFTNQHQKSKLLITTLEAAKDSSGGIPAADRDKLTTGFSAGNSQLWFYFHRQHIGATAWLVIAEKGINPFWLGSN
jgi:hypothetical protein